MNSRITIILNIMNTLTGLALSGEVDPLPSANGTVGAPLLSVSISSVDVA